MAASLSRASASSYLRVWSLFISLASQYTRVYLPLPMSHVMSFITTLYNRGLAAATITSYVSVLSFFNRLAGGPQLGNLFVVAKALEGARKSRPAKDNREPISISLLHTLVDKLPLVIAPASWAIIFQAMFLLMFHAFLRVGEVTLATNGSADNLLRRKDISFRKSDKGTPLSATLVIRNSKHHFGANFRIVLRASNSKFCPVIRLAAYLDNHPSFPEAPLFQTPNGLPISPTFFNKVLSKALSSAGHTQAYVRSHSFRIGAATHALAVGELSEEQIRKLGRWSSGAFKRYLRPSHL